MTHVSQEVSSLNPSDIIRRAAEAGIVPDAKRFFKYHELHQMLSAKLYTAWEDDSVLQTILRFHTDVQVLILLLNK